MNECINSLGDTTIVLRLDTSRVYWQVEIAEENRDETAFTSHYGLFRLTRMPFWLKSAPDRTVSNGRPTHEGQVAICPCLI